ncbi:hypothetical protein LINPERHAP1_LOCUS17674 [Linum perenne]
MGGEAVRYFQELFSGGEVEMGEVVNHIRPRVTEEDNGRLTREVSMEEFREALFSMDHNKAPGPDRSTAGKTPVVEWMLSITSREPEEVVQQVIAVLWAIWKERNARVWNNKTSEAAWIVKQGLDDLQDWLRARERAPSNVKVEGAVHEVAQTRDVSVVVVPSSPVALPLMTYRTTPSPTEAEAVDETWSAEQPAKSERRRRSGKGVCSVPVAARLIGQALPSR